MRFAVLGPLAVHEDSGARSIGTRKVQLLLALLLLEANRPVSVERIKLALWGDRPPSTVNASLYNHVAQLRRALAEPEALPGPPRISRIDRAYRLRVEAGELDADEFTGLVEAARRSYLQEDWPSVVREADAALALWRGSPLADLAPSLEAEGQLSHLSEARLQALEWSFDAQLARGRHHGLIPQLTALTAEHPWHETFHRQLMLVLHRSGRQGEALAVHRQLRDRLAEDLGVEPGPDVRAAHRAILAPPGGRPRAVVPRTSPATGQPAEELAEPRPGPAQLPMGTPYFVGRASQLAELREHLTSAGEEPAVAVVSGMAGVGKSALAARLGRSLAAHFPDGQLYLDLRGSTAGATSPTPAEALARLLTALGSDPQHIPEDPDAASARLRSALHGTRTLLVLDDAGSAALVRLLLPATPGCAVLITSRSPLATLDGTLRLSLAPLTESEALALITKVVGAERVAADESAARRILELCGRLPLALRVVAARLVARPSLSLRVLGGQLADETHRLDHLEYDDLSVRGSLTIAHRALTSSADPVERRAALALRRLGGIALIEYEAPVVARLLDCSVPEAEAALGRLVEVALVEEVQPGRYALHNLIRHFSRELSLRGDSDHDRAAAAGRAVRWYAELAGGTALRLQPAETGRQRVLQDTAATEVFTDTASAMAWYDKEYCNLRTLIEHHIAHPTTRPLTLVLVRALSPAMQHRGDWTAIRNLNELALTTARGCADHRAEAFALHDGACSHFMTGDFDTGLARIEAALALWRELGNRHFELAALNNRGLILESLGRYAEAAEVIEGVLELDQAADDYTRAVALNNLGNLYEHTDPLKAIRTHQRSLEVGLRLGLGGFQYTPHSNIGFAHLSLHRPDRALPHFEEAMRLLAQHDGDWMTEYTARLGYVRALRELGLHERAAAECQQLIESTRAHDDTYSEGLARHQYGLVLQETCDTALAVEQWGLALTALVATDNAAVLGELRDLLAAAAG
ncbi:tetratricopeptide repeat protein [Kitasatospora sp. NBC_01287]|uniref:AfsR/SARP family transcriptional regulator n=1 Tax=Kitasatospora sp. NBC_01287 TaxID=2903573 RepID=UPI00225A56BD|nr:BTAD domain-containing putative transcriptional regulator [Kitasatospora sp. NBC_01287]MCX4750511.1 tetratricopeptide repeat protein [Kitasatospora sp. NBC_01287]